MNFLGQSTESAQEGSPVNSSDVEMCVLEGPCKTYIWDMKCNPFIKMTHRQIVAREGYSSSCWASSRNTDSAERACRVFFFYLDPNSHSFGKPFIFHQAFSKSFFLCQIRRYCISPSLMWFSVQCVHCLESTAGGRGEQVQCWLKWNRHGD